MKAIAVQTIFIVITTVIFLFFALVIIFGFIDISGAQANQASCSTKLLNYCTFWVVKDFSEDGKPFKWGEKSPKECQKFFKDLDDATGPTKAQCLPIVK